MLQDDAGAQLSRLHSQCETLADAMTVRLEANRYEELHELSEGLRPLPSSDQPARRWTTILRNYFVFARALFVGQSRPAPEYARRRDGALRLELNYMTGGDQRFPVLGYLAPVGPTSVPVIIPPERLDGEIDWDTNTLDWNGVVYVDLRAAEEDHGPRALELAKALVANPVQIPATAAEISAEISPAPGAGRPSRGADIDAAYENIDKDFTQPLKSHFPLIREAAKRLSKNDSDTGLGDDTIRKRIAGRWKTDAAEMAEKR